MLASLESLEVLYTFIYCVSVVWGVRLMHAHVWSVDTPQSTVIDIYDAASETKVYEHNYSRPA